MAKNTKSATPAARRSFPAGGDGFEVRATVPGQTLPPRYSPESYANWFFEFLRADLASLSLGDRLRMQANAWAFAQPELIDDWPKKSLQSLPALKMLIAIQTAARSGMVRLHGGEDFLLEKGIKYGIAVVGRRVVRCSRQGTFPDLFLAAVMEMLQAFWSQVRACPTCGEQFLKTGKRKFCSPDCARRAHWAAYEARHGDRDHHAEYLQRVHKRLGAKVRVRKRETK